MGYLKAADELRRSYQQSLSTKWQEDNYDEGMPGAFPDADIVRSGDEEMLLFPSYARKHTKATHSSQEGHIPAPPGARGDVDNPDTGDADYWRREWQKYEDENAIVDVDVRGWIYTPQRGPLSRRNRLMVAVARRLSGLPAPDNSSPTASRESSQAPHFRQRLQDDLLSQEEEAAAREADSLARRGEREAEAASKGKYGADAASLLEHSPVNSRSSSPARTTVSRVNSEYDYGDSASIHSSNQRQSWNSTYMTREEITNANDQLMRRLRPFMTMPLANTAITIFFYNEKKSQSKSVYTDDSGHFKVRAALNFVPTKVRVLASENLSATEDVMVTDSHGISLVSDIDDTIKHSAIASGAKEIFKNTFLRELGELVIPGVKEWYCRMADMGVKLHYVSNSPWQLYPLLRSYFSMAGLPHGSFHLKQYSGMLQGIFEPAAERKKGSLDRIMHDFPERKFILVGDSGEADLEVYTDIVQEHPGRVLAVFIRDVTSKDENNLKDFFYAASPTGPNSRSPSRSNTPHNSDQQNTEKRPALPDRSRPSSVVTDDLIDFSDEPPASKVSRSSHSAELEELSRQNGKASPPNRPVKPAKPSNLRSFSTASPPPTPPPKSKDAQSPRMRHSDSDVKRYPPPPPAPRRTGTNQSTTSVASSDRSSAGQTGERYYAQTNKPPAPSPASRTLWEDSAHYSGPPSRPEYNSTDSTGYLASARHQLATAYNALPPLRSQPPGTTDPSNPNGPPLPPRRGLSSYPAAAARFVTGASGGDPLAGGDGGAPGAPIDKKLEIWRRRWARSEDIMRKNGVTLAMWRNGGDVMDRCTDIVERAFKEMDREDGRTGRSRNSANVGDGR